MIDVLAKMLDRVIVIVVERARPPQWSASNLVAAA